MADLSPARRRALEIVRDNPGIKPSEFAAKMWPDSDGWNRPRKCGGYGVHRGGGMYVSAGCYLGRLAKDGLIHRHHKDYWTEAHLSSVGRAALTDPSQDTPT